MQAQPALLSFTEAERPASERLLKLARETDRIEGYTEPHAVRLAQLAERLGAQLGFHGVDLTALKFAALAHDLGEHQMKRNYLLSPHKLTQEETLDLWRHPILGEQAASELRLPRHTQLLIRWHQEWWNGQGYPDGLAGEHIPLGARVLRAVDSYCALTSDRPYRQHYSAVDAEQMLADLAGIEFDPLVITLLLALLAEERQHDAPEVWYRAPEAQLLPMAEPIAEFAPPAERPEPPEAATAEAEPAAVNEIASTAEEPTTDAVTTPIEEAPEDLALVEKPAEWPILTESQPAPATTPVALETPPRAEVPTAPLAEPEPDEAEPKPDETERSQAETQLASARRTDD